MGGWRQNEPIPALHSDPSPPAAVIPSSCLRFTTVTTVTCVSQPVCSVTWDRTAGLPKSQYSISLKQCVCVRVSGSTKYRCSRISLHRDNQGQTAERGHSRLLSGDKSTVCIYFHAFDCKLKPTHSFKCHLMTQFWAPPTSICIIAVREKDWTSQHEAPSCRALLWFSSRLYFQSSKRSAELLQSDREQPGAHWPIPHPLVQPTKQPTNRSPQQPDPKHN